MRFADEAVIGSLTRRAAWQSQRMASCAEVNPVMGISHSHSLRVTSWSMPCEVNPSEQVPYCRTTTVVVGESPNI